MSKPAGGSGLRVARRLLRHEWQPTSPTAQAIETAVAELLSDPAQAELAERNCSRLRGRVGLQSKFRAWLPLCKRPDGP